MEKQLGTFLGLPVILDDQQTPVNSLLAFGSWTERRKCTITKAEDGTLEIHIKEKPDAHQT